MMRTFIALLLALATALVTSEVAAHKASDSYLTLERNGNEIRGQWDISLRDLDAAIGIDADGDGAMQWHEVKAKHAAISRYALSRLTLTAGGRPCHLSVGEQLLERHTDGTYSVLPLSGRCASSGALSVDYRLLFDLDAQHRGLLKLTDGSRTTSAIFPVENPVQFFSLQDASASSLSTLTGFIADGIKHIAIGFDHLLFLIALLLPAVLIREGGNWRPVATLPKALMQVAGIVSAFTVAHSITLSLATLGVVSPPSRWVESLIAVSVVITAIDNIVPCLPRRRWLVAFAFGLIHGFGFASVLQELNLPSADLVLSLTGFNVGVELGQLGLVGVVLPIAYLLRARAAYPRFAVAGGSMVIAVIAAGWLLERSLHLEFMPF